MGFAAEDSCLSRSAVSAYMCMSNHVCRYKSTVMYFPNSEPFLQFLSGRFWCGRCSLRVGGSRGEFSVRVFGVRFRRVPETVRRRMRFSVLRRSSCEENQVLHDSAGFEGPGGRGKAGKEGRRKDDPVGPRAGPRAGPTGRLFVERNLHHMWC